MSWDNCGHKREIFVEIKAWGDIRGWTKMCENLKEINNVGLVYGRCHKSLRTCKILLINWWSP